MPGLLFSVLHGRQELGYVDETSFLGKQEGPRILLLGGRAWLVNYIDWQRKRAYVEATEQKGRSRWKGQGTGLGYQLSQAILQVLTDTQSREFWSSRATEQIQKSRGECPWLTHCETVAIPEDGKLTWWTFAGERANATMAHALSQLAETHVDHDSFSLTFEAAVQITEFFSALEGLKQQDMNVLKVPVDEKAIDGLKFSECLPAAYALNMLEARLSDTQAVLETLRRKCRGVTSA